MHCQNLQRVSKVIEYQTCAAGKPFVCSRYNKNISLIGLLQDKIDGENNSLEHTSIKMDKVLYFKVLYR